MFSVKQKREIADAVQAVLRATNHPELPEGEIEFGLHVQGAQPWSWADIQNNRAVPVPDVNPHNEATAAAMEAETARREEEAAALREDKARLDWLDAQRNFMVRRMLGGVEVSGFGRGEDEMYGECVRLAIDRARKAAES